MKGQTKERLLFIKPEQTFRKLREIQDRKNKINMELRSTTLKPITPHIVLSA